MDDKTIWSLCYAAGMAILTAIAEGATWIEPDRLIWVLGIAGALFGAAFFPSSVWWRTIAKLLFGTLIAVVTAKPLAGAHYAPSFVNQNVAALYLGFAGPAIFMATLEGKAMPWLKR